MNSTRTSVLLLSLLHSFAALPAQANPGRAAPGDLPPWSVPFHQGADAREAWAAGPSFKVRVDDGMTFFPRLGSGAPAHRPLRWRTEDVRLDGKSTLAAGRPAPGLRTNGHRAELDHGGILEAYDSRDDGVEQTFVLERPAARIEGDLEIVGAIDGPLCADERGLAHAPIVFRDSDGTDSVAYGSAWAIDAAGRRIAIGSSYSGRQVRLRVPSAWLGTAAWPVTVDPLLSAAPLVTTTADAASPAVLRVPSANRIFVVESRDAGAGDWDVLMRAYDDGWNPLGVVYSDITNTVSLRLNSLAYAEGEGRLVLAMAAQLGVGAYIRLYFHDATSLVKNSGTILNVVRPAGSQDTQPAIGGSVGRYCYLAFRRDWTPLASNTNQSRVLGVLVDAQTKSVGADQDLHTLAGNNFDAERPSINARSTNSGWVVAWQEYNYDNANDDWDIIAQRIKNDGTLGSAAVVGYSASGYHKLTPHVDGSGARFAVCYLLRQNENTKTTTEDGTALVAARIDWSTNGVASMGPNIYVNTHASPVIRLGFTTRALAHDPLVGTLWGVAWQRLDQKALRIARFGHDAYVAEQGQLASSLAQGEYVAPSLCYDSYAPGFLAVYTSTGAAINTTLGTRFVHGPAKVSTFGAGCAGTIDCVNNATTLPYPGSEFFAVRLQGGRPNAMTVLALGIGAASLPIPGGAPGCKLLIDPTQTLVTLGQGMTQPAGSHIVPIPIPSTAQGAGLVWQFVQLDLGRLWSSNGLVTDVY